MGYMLSELIFIMRGCIFTIDAQLLSAIIASWDIALHDIIIFTSASDMCIFFIIAMHPVSFIIASPDMAMQECIIFLSLDDIIAALAGEASAAAPASASIASPRAAVFVVFISRSPVGVSPRTQCPRSFGSVPSGERVRSAPALC